MADLNYKFSGVNTAQLANEVETLRQHSSTFRALEAAAAAAGYTTIEIRMGAGLLSGNIADSRKTDSSTRTIRINSDATGSWGVGGRQATVGEVIAHELAHAVVPPQYKQDATFDPLERDSEGMWVRRQAGKVAVELGLPGANNTDYPITKIPIDEEQICTLQNPLAAKPEDGVLFLDGSRGYNGKGSTIPPGPGSQDSIGSRRLATDQTGQPLAPAGSGNPFQLPQLGHVTPLTQATPNRPDTFDNRFGSWGPAPVNPPGETISPVLRALENYRRSATPDGAPSTLAPGTAAPTNLPVQPPAVGKRSENTDGAPGSDNYSRQLNQGQLRFSGDRSA
jgi:hypothetical protein